MSNETTVTPTPAEPLRNARFSAKPGLVGVLAGQPPLGSGSRGPAVSAVQQALVDMGFSVPGGVDGSFGAQSSKALRNFQMHTHAAFPQVDTTGVVDIPTLRALDALAPPPGQKGQTGHLPVPSYQGTPVRVVVVKNEHRTFLFDAQGKLQGIYGNAVGRGKTPTDPGLKKVTGKLNEAESHALGMKLWGSWAFGSRLVDLSWATGKTSGEELHGTNAPTQLGEDVSHGCVRHANADIEVIWNALKLGDKVAIVERVDDPNLGNPKAPSAPSSAGVA